MLKVIQTCNNSNAKRIIAFVSKFDTYIKVKLRGHVKTTKDIGLGGYQWQKSKLLYGKARHD